MLRIGRLDDRTVDGVISEDTTRSVDLKNQTPTVKGYLVLINGHDEGREGSKGKFGT